GIRQDAAPAPIPRAEPPIMWRAFWNWKQTTTRTRRANTFRPQLESLEGRDVPSTLTVTNNLDSGAGSLRAEIAAAHKGDSIVFAPGLAGQTINLTSGELLINTDVTVTGPGAGQLTVSGGTAGAFDVAANHELTLSGLTIANSGYGTIPTSGGGSQSVLHTAGGALENSGTLTLNGCTLSGNRAVEGGAIYNAGTLTIGAGCLLTNNSATSFGG